MITEMVYNQYKRMWKCHPWRRTSTRPYMGLDDPKVLAIAEYEYAHKDDIPLEQRFLDDTEIEELLHGDDDPKDGCVRCWMGYGVSGNTPCRDGKTCNCTPIPDGETVEDCECNNEGSCTTCKMST